jgi:hypothetical protein
MWRPADLHHRDPIPMLRILEREQLVVAVDPGGFMQQRRSSGWSPVCVMA